MSLIERFQCISVMEILLFLIVSDVVGTCASTGEGLESALDWLHYQWTNKAAQRG